MKIKSKSGISLIVLVITIIVMIILAAAIILSLSNSGIIGKANKAKTDSDTASLKEYVNTLRAEWELMTADERTESGSATFEDYANSKLEENGYKQGYVASDGTVYANLQENAKNVLKAGIKIGDIVTGYTVTEKSYTTSGEENTGNESTLSEVGPQPNTVKTNMDITWKYLGINSNGEIEIMADLSTTKAVDENTKIILSGKGGFLRGPGMLNTVCKELYSVSEKGTARSMNIDDVNNILGYTGEKGSYYSKSTGVYTPMKEPMTIGEIVKQKGEPSLTDDLTPDGKDINTYSANYYFIDKTKDISEITKPENLDLVYNAKNAYWLGSTCTLAGFGDGYAFFFVRIVYSKAVNGAQVLYSYGDSHSFTYAIRPVVTLNSNATVSYDSSTHTLTVS